VGAGCLRGVGRLSSALVSDIIGFWVLGIPVGCWLALGPLGMSTFGIWSGFAFGVAVVMTPIVVKAWNVGEVSLRLEESEGVGGDSVKEIVAGEAGEAAEEDVDPLPAAR
jgi:hypothetical protein